jgi:hypothetical protein
MALSVTMMVLRSLFQQFCVKELTVNIRSSECKIHTHTVAGFCALPQVYLAGQEWTAEDDKLYKPITKDIVDGVTHELTLQNIDQDPNWITKSACIVTSNVDRAIINAEAVKAFGKHNNVPVLQRKCKLSLDFPSQPKQYYMTNMKDPSSLHILYKEAAVRFWTMQMVMCILVLHMVPHVQFVP